ncbi:HAD family hydrolase [Haloprofundus marisrubri]|uniref:HAD family hydrolase n=1 Tax=Haloprofundus marisrubri TaxID=1514971 RepID=UPI000A85E6A8|nr:HAD family hydrolase [Haloprofundus marisrubri]
MAVTFDLFGTLVEAAYPDDPAAAVAAELDTLGVAVPDDWDDAYLEVHIDAPEGAEVPLPAHVSAALGSRDVDAPNNAARRAVVNAFDPEIRTRADAVAAVEAAADRGPVGLLSNCSVPELARRTLIRSEIPNDAFDATVTSVACGWRKPDARAFETVASALGVAPADLVHVGDDARTDGGIEALGGEFVDVSDTPLSAVAARFQSGRTGDCSGGPTDDTDDTNCTEHADPDTEAE